MSKNTAEPAPVHGAASQAVWPMAIEQIQKWTKVYKDSSFQDRIQLIVEDMRERDVQGTAKYGVPLSTFNGRNALVDAYQELLDASVYLKQRLAELNAPLDGRVSERINIEHAQVKVFDALITLRPLLPPNPAAVPKVEAP